MLFSDSGASTTVTVNGNINAAAWGISAFSDDNDSKTDITVTGDVTAGFTGVDASAYAGGTFTANITGEVTGGKNGIFAHTDLLSCSFEDYIAQAGTDTTVDITVTGNVSAKPASEQDKEDLIAGINIDDRARSISISVKDKDDPNNSDISGNVTLSDVGLYLLKADTDSNSSADAESSESSEASGSSDVLIEGVLHGDTTAVMVSSNVTPDDLTLTVWKVDPNESGNVVEIKGSGTAADDTAEKNREAIEKSIQYIIKIEQPKEGEEVYFKVDLQKGYKLTGAFNGLGEKVAMLTDDQGNYYVAVPKGGGVYLSAVLEKIPEPEPEPEPEPQPEPMGIVVEAASIMFTFDLDGGTLNGETGKLVKWYFPGQTIELPEPPTPLACAKTGRYSWRATAQTVSGTWMTGKT